MSNNPGLYGDIGKNARDILYKDYTRTSAVPFDPSRLSWSFNVAGKIAGSVPGLNTAFKLSIPDLSQVEMQYLNEFVGITAGIGMKANPFKGLVEPFLNFSGVLGTSLVSIGADVELDIIKRTVNEFNAGMNLTTSFLTASITTNEKLDTVRASFYQAINPLSRTGIAAEARVTTDGLAGVVVQQELWHKFYLRIAGEVVLNRSNFTPKLGFSMSLRP